ncbi:hypothetical protein FDE76_05445 [Clostridium botulinum]|uniref:Uncharacterized protein n=1 Tax=Clostridium botulinum (strain Eklund 17B / Type B) TaxID=935198 RepID=B2TNL0_CLOBB|nr:hypothetical protein CLL_A2629 [Clostridium botulinum B str. Eklund 17B (NRP)]MBY6976139.1 hypothetical protein [Clostridium botulinum]MBY7000562.1 hypothetical protein [Clostridium botulinum]MCR1273322.1 hypothetical protein [Clostridium botulinum]NFD70421.1 hypothetical protein [Clostridium botulinum]
MAREAEHNFYSEAYQRNEKERGNWHREVVEAVINSSTDKNIDINGRKFGTTQKVNDFKKMLKFLNNYELNSSNDIITNNIIKRFLEAEQEQPVKEIVSRAWIGLWDSTESINACVNKKDFYDDSYLIRFTTELQILIRKVAELYCTAILFDMMKPAKGKVLEFLNNMIGIQLHDIQHDNDEIGVFDYIDILPDGFRNVYEIIFYNVFSASCAFVIFHEIGHKIEVENEIAVLYDVNSSILFEDGHQRQIQCEFNADDISMKIIESLYGKEEVSDWLGYAGILVCFMTLAINTHSLLKETDHPSIKSRYMRAVNFIKERIDETSFNKLLSRIDILGRFLAIVTEWEDKSWWK